MRRLAVALLTLAFVAAWAAAQGAALNERAKSLHETMAGMRTAQQSLIFAGFDGELGVLAAQKAESVIAAQEAEGSPAEAEAAEDLDLREDSLAALESLASAYQLRQRSRMIRKFCDDFPNLSALEDALVSDFRNYSSLNLDLVPENAVVQGGVASVRVKYNLSMTQVGRSATDKFEGRTSFDFKRGPDGKVCLAEMADRLFGSSLPQAQLQLPTRQGPPVSTRPNLPGAQAVTLSASGSVTLEGQNVTFFSFKTLAASSQAQADLRRDKFGNLAVGSGDVIMIIGACNINTLKAVPSVITGRQARFMVGQCYAVKTDDGLYHVLKGVGFAAGGPEFQFQVRSRRDGTTRINP